MVKTKLNYWSSKNETVVTESGYRFFIGFGKVKLEKDRCSIADPRYNMGYNGLFENVGVDAYWYEYRVFVNDKPFFKYKSKDKKNIIIKRFLCWMWVNVN